MLWVALHFPRLSLDTLERTQDPAEQTAIAIADRLNILSSNACALRSGVRKAMKRATALALTPELKLLDHDPARDQQALHSIACWSLQFTPSLGFAPPPVNTKGAVIPGATAPTPDPDNAGLLLEISSSLKLFGGLPRLLDQLQSGLGQLGYQTHVGVAPTATAAWLFALHEARYPSADQHGPLSGQSSPEQRQAQLDRLLALAIIDQHCLQQQLAPLPVNLLTHAHPHITALNAIGAHTIGQLLELPRAGLARRFGKNLLLEVDCALGGQAQVMAYFQAPQRFSSKLELLADVELTEPLLFAAHRLILELTGWLAARQSALRRFDLIAQHNRPPNTSVSVHLSNPSRDPERLTSLLRERLNIVQLRAPVHTIFLKCDRITAQAAGSGSLFSSPTSDQENLGRLLERLQARLGREQVQRLYLAHDHRPESAYRICVVDSLAQLGKSTPPTSRRGHSATANRAAITTPSANAMQAQLVAADSGALPRPLWLLRQPLSLPERNNRPWLHSPLNILAGPERIETGWWDSHLVQRDYFVAQDDKDALYWIFRERQSHGVSGWFMHGRFG